MRKSALIGEPLFKYPHEKNQLKMTQHLFTADHSLDLAPNPCAGRDPVAVQSEFTLSNVEGSGGNINQKPLKMQNKPNLSLRRQGSSSTISPYFTRLYQSLATQRDGRNNAKTNPIQPPSNPIQTQSNPIPNRPEEKILYIFRNFQKNRNNQHPLWTIHTESVN
jgi:hypothetical protein